MATPKQTAAVKRNVADAPRRGIRLHEDADLEYQRSGRQP